MDLVILGLTILISFVIAGGTIIPQNYAIPCNIIGAKVHPPDVQKAQNSLQLSAFGIDLLSSTSGCQTAGGDIIIDTNSVIHPSGSIEKLEIVGNTLVDSSTDKTVFLQGFVASGLENNCNYNHPYLLSDFQTMVTLWHANAVIIPILPRSYNNNCNGYVDTLHKAIANAFAAGLYVGLTDHENSGNDNPSSATQASIQMWDDISNYYKNEGRLFYEILSEPHKIDENTWRNGNGKFIGIQNLANNIHAIDPTRLLFVNSRNWGGVIGRDIDPNNPSTWITGSQTSYSVHLYDNGSNKDPANWPQDFGNLSAKFPMIAAEFGSNNGTCNSDGFLASILPYMRSHLVGYFAWTYQIDGDMCGRPRVINDWSGQPNRYGQPIFDYYIKQ